MNKNIDALVTYCWNRVGYNVLRSLAAKGVRVIVGDANKLAMARFSRYGDDFFQYPSFYKNPASFVNSLTQQVKDDHSRVYLPVHEEIFIAAKYREQLEQSGFIVPIADFDVLEQLHKKECLFDVCQKYGIPTPEIYRITSLDNLPDIFSSMAYPVVIKDSQTNSAKGVHYIHNRDGAEAIYSRLCETKDQYPFVQQYVKGNGYGVSVLMNHGEVRAVFTHKRLREKTYTGGTSTVRVSVREPLLEEYAIELLSRVKFHGVAMVEFKYDKKSNTAMVIDVNPRFWGSLSLAIQSGVDFPYLLYQMATDGDIDPVMDYKLGVKVKWLLGDVLSLMSEMGHTKQLITPIKGFLSGSVDGYDDFFLDDPVPFLFEGLYYFNKFVSTQSVNPSDEALLDIDAI